MRARAFFRILRKKTGKTERCPALLCIRFSTAELSGRLCDVAGGGVPPHDSDFYGANSNSKRTHTRNETAVIVV